MAEHGSEKERTSKRQERIEACAKMQCPWANGRPIQVFFVEGLRTADCCVLCPLVISLSARCCGPCRCDRYPWALNRRVSVFGTLRTCRQNIHSNQVAAFDAGDIQCIVGHGAVPSAKPNSPVLRTMGMGWIRWGSCWGRFDQRPVTAFRGPAREFDMALGSLWGMKPKGPLRRSLRRFGIALDGRLGQAWTRTQAILPVS